MTAYYSNTTAAFLEDDTDAIIARLSKSDAASGFTQLSHAQIRSWRETIGLTREALRSSDRLDEFVGVVFEYRIPRREKRVDCVVLSRSGIIVIEFKAGSTEATSAAVEQGVDYALDIAHYHEASQSADIHVIICPTESVAETRTLDTHDATLASLQTSGGRGLRSALESCLRSHGNGVELETWVRSRYRPIPGILDAVKILFSSHASDDIKTCLASSETVDRAVDCIHSEMEAARAGGDNRLILLTGVPGSGKTLVGLKLAHRASDNDELPAVYLSGNGPLLKVIRAALARDYSSTGGCTLAEAKRYAESLLHSVHSFIEESARTTEPPVETVVVFDEAQRAWDRDKMTKMHARRRRLGGVYQGPTSSRIQSEPRTLLEIMSRSGQGSVVVALCGNGQEIHDGEAGVQEWMRAGAALEDWSVVASDEALRLVDGEVPHSARADKRLHLDVPLRSHRATAHTRWVDAVLSGDSSTARGLISQGEMPILCTRTLDEARAWLEKRCIGSRRYGIFASSGAARLRPYGIEVSAEFRKGLDYPLWFTAPKGDIRSSYALETAATEFECQGLEIDWAIVMWSWDLLVDEVTTRTRAFRGSAWSEMRSERMREFLVDKYRVLLTRAREGMIVVAPLGSSVDTTRSAAEMDELAEYLRRCGVCGLSTYQSGDGANS